ncbi:endoglucanase A-like isoform X1 [Biomphalaria glabrata]|uniref:Endoglucanase n=1 Tax=Biomphalaria glabrata TaxID=6526 RepID=A0A9W2ZY08_BIOGL|nr:endoglucanase A-like isoform X1 [Biomphalaria glabrata]XP_055879855.1 endoglucanase A-like isoform X1 [Biomphalaria glabrata]
MWCRLLLLVVVLFSPVTSDITVPVTNHWNGGFQASACFPITEEMHSWTVTLTFDQPLTSLNAYTADVKETLEGGKVFVLHNKDWNKEEHVGDKLCLDFQGHGTGDIAPVITGTIHAGDVTGAPNTAASTTQHSTSSNNMTPTTHTASTARTTQTAHVTTKPPTHSTTASGPTHAPVYNANGYPATMTLIREWSEGFTGELVFYPGEDLLGWVVNITFSSPVTGVEAGLGQFYKKSPDGRVFTMVSMPDQGVFKAGQKMRMVFISHFLGNGKAPTATAVLYNMGKDTWKVNPAVTTDTSKYNYNDLLYKSILFYEAQRSGKLPANNRIPYRGDSALNDTGDNHEDLTGGWYDAGDDIKFNFPMAYSVTVLAWGYIMYPEAYKSAGQEDYLLDSIKWPLDYLLKCHTKDEELYVQVGNATKDHAFWGPPEKMIQKRPSFRINSTKPGTDVAMETAAAFAAGSIAFKAKDPSYSTTLLNHAKKLWDFGNKYRELYSNSLPGVSPFYRSNNYTDELCWGSLWLYQATNDLTYLAEAEKYFDPHPASEFSWDDKTVANQVLLYKLRKLDTYKMAVENTFKYWFPGGSSHYTPKGLAYSMEWGSLRHAANLALVALVAADNGIHTLEYRHWAMCQIHYALGDTGFSYVIGFGDKYPLRPHHRSSSCPFLPAHCGPPMLNLTEPNVHTLYGALVSGPGPDDSYSDVRTNYLYNDVACDYNAGFQSAVAALKSLWLRSEHPEQQNNAKCPYVSGGSDNIIG